MVTALNTKNTNYANSSTFTKSVYYPTLMKQKSTLNVTRKKSIKQLQTHLKCFHVVKLTYNFIFYTRTHRHTHSHIHTPGEDLSIFSPISKKNIYIDTTLDIVFPLQKGSKKRKAHATHSVENEYQV